MRVLAIGLLCAAGALAFLWIFCWWQADRRAP